MGKLYTFVYKCCYCGEFFNTSYTGESMAISCLAQTACDLPRDKQHPGDRTIHITGDHIGIADLVGCKIKED